MSRQPNVPLEALLNKCDSTARVIAHAVPTRILRITQVDTEGLTFRVEQLVEHGGFGGAAPKGEWKTLSTHGSKVAGQSLGVAFEAMWKAQKDLIYKLKKQMMARMPSVVLPNGAAR